jgi:hypothetical protein
MKALARFNCRKVHIICELLPLPTDVIIAGRGISATVIKLKNSANTDLLHSEHWETLKGTKSQEGIVNGGFRDLTFNGNRENNTAPSESLGLISIYGKAFICKNFYIQNAAGHGFFSEWGTGGAEMEAWLDTFKIFNCTKTGLVWHGPHDSHITNGQLFICEQYGVRTGGEAASEKFTNIHCYGTQSKISWLLEAYGARLLGCEGEGGKECDVSVQGNHTSIIGGQFFLSPIGIKMGVAGKELTGCHIETLVFECSTTALELIEDFYNYYNLDIVPNKASGITEGELYKGTISSTSTLLISPKRGELLPILHYANRPATPSAPAETTAGNTKAINELRETLKKLSLTS